MVCRVTAYRARRYDRRKDAEIFHRAIIWRWCLKLLQEDTRTYRCGGAGTQKKHGFIRRLKEQTAVQGPLRTELLRVKAAELQGLAIAADVYILKAGYRNKIPLMHWD
ncbi:hypothetical protein KCP69_19130 [Salmonella enterica subsp. enterica]|nr:hypothetical protein KCP69_19130 [Salmonella enterica subsp. enterica]